MILRDGLTYDQWRDKFGAQLLIGIAYCQLMVKVNPTAARETLAPLTEAQVKDMPDDTYWSALMFKVDEEIQRLEALAKPDEQEMELRQKIRESPKDLDHYDALAVLLIHKNRLEEAVPVLLDIITIDRNFCKQVEGKQGEKKKP